MKTSKIFKSKTFVSLTYYEMVKIVGGENVTSNGNQNTSTSNANEISSVHETNKLIIQNIR